MGVQPKLVPLFLLQLPTQTRYGTHPSMVRMVPSYCVRMVS